MQRYPVMLRRTSAVVLLSGLATLSTAAVADDAGESAREAISEAEAAIRGEVLKAALANKTVKEGLEVYRQKQAVQTRAVEMREALRQADVMCQTIQTQNTVGAAQQQAQARIYAAQARTLRPAAKNASTAATLEAAHKVSNEHFCTADEQSLGVCRVSMDPQYDGLAGADQNAMFLFQSGSGSPSFVGGRDGSQAEAAAGFIARVVSALPPEQLHGNASTYQKNPQARAYAELQRRYMAFISMASYSLNQIKESRTPLK